MIPRTSEYVALHSKKNLQLRLIKDFEIEIILDYLDGPKGITKDYKKWAGGSESRERSDDGSRVRYIMTDGM